MKNKILIITFILFFITVSSINAQNNVKLYFFYGEGCPHCAKEEVFLDKLEQKYPQLEVVRYETYYNKENADLFVKLSEACGTKAMGVPTTFIDEEAIVGFDNVEGIGKKIEDKVKECIEQGCDDPMHKITGHEPTCESGEENESIINVPVIGKVDPKKVSLPIFTVVIGFLDGFNPCAMWVLCFLLTLLIHARSRKKIILIGSIFVFFSGLVYFLFMTAWLNFFLLVGYVNVLRIIIAIIAIVMGLISIKDFFLFKKGLSLTIPEKAKPKLFKKMRSLVYAQALPAVIIGTVVLAFTANTFELLCTAGFPAVYTRILTLNNLPSVVYYFYLALYNIVYVIPLAVIVTMFAVTMGAHKFTEKQGRILKLIAGLLMLALGLILILKPALLMF